MNFKELISKYNNFFDLISKKQIKDAFDILKELVEKCKILDLKNQLDNNYNIYQNILKYSFELGDDPEKENVYGRLLKSVTELADDAKENIICNYKLLSYYQYKAEIKKGKHLDENASDEIVKHLEFEREIIQMLNSTPGAKKSTSTEEEKYKKSLINIFKIIWLTDKFKEGEIELVDKIRKTKSLPWYDKCLIISSLTLSLLRHFDSNKIALLFKFYETEENHYFASHCTCPTQLGGPQDEQQPYLLRRFAHANEGSCAIQVLWPPGNPVTMMRYHPGKEPALDVYAGKVVTSHPMPPVGGCTTNVEIELTDRSDACMVQGHHNLLFCGEYARKFRLFAQLYKMRLAETGYTGPWPL